MGILMSSLKHTDVLKCLLDFISQFSFFFVSLAQTTNKGIHETALKRSSVLNENHILITLLPSI